MQANWLTMCKGNKFWPGWTGFASPRCSPPVLYGRGKAQVASDPPGSQPRGRKGRKKSGDWKGRGGAGGVDWYERGRIRRRRYGRDERGLRRDHGGGLHRVGGEERETRTKRVETWDALRGRITPTSPWRRVFTNHRCYC